MCVEQHDYVRFYAMPLFSEIRVGLQKNWYKRTKTCDDMPNKCPFQPVTPCWVHPVQGVNNCRTRQKRRLWMMNKMVTGNNLIIYRYHRKPSCPVQADVSLSTQPSSYLCLARPFVLCVHHFCDHCHFTHMSEAPDTRRMKHNRPVCACNCLRKWIF